MRHKFVELIPDKIDDEILYISIEYSTAVHKCACGCGNEVVTPITPTDWSMTYYGDSISLDPSIGNWSFECRSHYWIKRGKIIHCRKWNSSEVESGRKKDMLQKKEHYEKKKSKFQVILAFFHSLFKKRAVAK